MASSILFVQYRRDFSTCPFGILGELQVSLILRWSEPMCFRISSKLDTTVKTEMQEQLEKGTRRKKLKFHGIGVLVRRQEPVHILLTEVTEN